MITLANPLLYGYGEAVLASGYRAVERIALDRDTSSFGDESAKLLARHALRRRGTSIVVNLFFDDSSVEIVGAKTQGNLRDFGRQHLPVCLDVREVIEQQATDGNLTNITEASGRWQVVECRIFRMKG